MRKKKQKKNRIPQILGLTVLFVLLFIGWNMLGPQPEIPKPISQAAEDFKKVLELDPSHQNAMLYLKMTECGVRN